MSWSCFGSIEEFVTRQRALRVRRAIPGLDALLTRRAIADRRARFVIALANESGFYGKVIGRGWVRDDLTDASWWMEDLNSVQRARLLVAAGGLAW